MRSLRILLAGLMIAGLIPAAPAEPPSSIAFVFSAKPQWFWTFWQGETADGYRKKMAEVILPLTATPGSAIKVVTFENPALPDQIERDRSPWPFHQHLCELSGATWLVSFRVSNERPIFSPFQGDVFSNREAPSAHWPELYWVTYNCKTGERSSGRPILSPSKKDRFVFETDLKGQAQSVLQTMHSSVSQ